VARNERTAIISRIEKTRNSRVLTYICSDRQGAAANIGEDAVRPMYDHVRQMGETESIDLYLYSRGGSVEVPWRIVTMLREHCDKLGVLIPYRAHSAATLIALGCDEIIMTRKAELGPVDPALSRITQEGGTAVQEEIRVEDVMSYIAFLRDKAGLGDQAAIAENVRILAETLKPWVLGSLYRTHSHIRSVARRLLACHKTVLDEQRMNVIIESLAEKTYSHGHAIGPTEAKELGLPITRPDADLETAIWQLFEEYERAMDMRVPVDVESLLTDDQDELEKELVIAMIESVALNWAFCGKLKAKRVRQAPSQVNININLGVSLPPGLDQAQVPQEVINQLVQQVQNAVPILVREQARRQSPVLRVEARLSGYWQDVTAKGI
jgi:hypothetical protein